MPQYTVTYICPGHRRITRLLFIQVGLPDGGTHTHACGQMNDHLRAMECHGLRRLLFIANIEGIKLVAVDAPAGFQIGFLQMVVVERIKIVDDG